ncbi:MAG TPA: DNA mismatch repair endonuclease MutL [Thermoplasmata archaeon]|nr:DNA mismatch repair endonuclease MutL [Thermoplasmata archaeon]
MSPSRRPIRRLDAGTIERIAAGEVVERPASVVKELVENSVDAGARSISVRLAAGGTERIEVADDGTGIPADELEIALERHATSKIAGADELEGVRTLGFRGEALAAIAAVSRLDLLSRPPGAQEARGVSSEGGQVGPPYRVARAPGTTVSVEALFFNTPARRKFLRSPAREQLEVVEVLQRAYLARPEIALDLSSEEGERIRLPATGSLAEAAGHVFGTEFDRNRFEVRGNEGPRIAIAGWLAGPSVSRSTARGLYLSVNGRPVDSRPITQAVRVAYADRMPRTRHPVGVLQLVIDPARLDVNVHPTKREIRFDREGELADWIRRTVRSALAGEGGPASPSSEPERFAAIPATGAAEPVASSDADWSLAFAGARQARLDGEAAPSPVAKSPAGPGLSLLGVLGRLYWVAESGEDLLLIDQHAASERLWFEALRASTRLAQQRLVQPAALQLTPREESVARERTEYLAGLGFELEAMGGGSWWVRAVPSYRGRLAPAEELPRLLAELADGGRPSVPDGLADRVAASVACHAAVRAGDRIEPEEMGRILAAVYALPGRPTSCPHGRPIAVRLPRSRLDRWFGRSGA